MPALIKCMILTSLRLFACTEWAWKHVSLLVGGFIVVRKIASFLAQIILSPWSLFSCWCWFNLPHVTRKHLNIFIWIKLCMTRRLCYSQIIVLISVCVCVCVFVHFRSSYVLLPDNSLTDFPPYQTLRRWWVFTGHTSAANFDCLFLGAI